MHNFLSDAKTVNKARINKIEYKGTTMESSAGKCLFFYGSRLAFASDKRDFAIGVMPSGEPLQRV